MTGEAKAILKAATEGNGFDWGALLPMEPEARFTNPFQFAYMLTLLKTKTIHMLSISYTMRFGFRLNLHRGRYEVLFWHVWNTQCVVSIWNVTSTRFKWRKCLYHSKLHLFYGPAEMY